MRGMTVEGVADAGSVLTTEARTEPPHPSRYAGHLLPRGEKDAYSTPSSSSRCGRR